MPSYIQCTGKELITVKHTQKEQGGTFSFIFAIFWEVRCDENLAGEKAARGGQPHSITGEPHGLSPNPQAPHAWDRTSEQS